MGLQNNQSGNYINIIGGKLTQRVPEGTEGSISRTNKNGKVVHEMKYDSFEGMITGIRTQDGNFGKNWVFELQDGEENYQLRLSYSNSYATALLKMLPNIDVAKPVKITPKQEEIDGKTKTALFVNQDGKAIKHAYTKNEPNGLPEWEQITVKGQKEWDSTKQLEFLEDMVNKDIVPKLPKQEVPQDQKDLINEDINLDDF